MHLGNGALTPACAVTAFSISGIGLTIAGWTARRMGIDRTKAMSAALLGSLIFSAQMLNVPVLPFASAHLVGGVLLAWLLGPGLGACTMAIVLTAQCVILGDGGLMSLGANIFNMALLPAVMVAWLKPRMQTKPNMAIGALSGMAVLLAAGLISLEVAAGRTATQLVDWSSFAWQMIWTHALIGLAEGVVTVALVRAWSAESVKPHLPRRAAVTMAVSLVLLVLAHWVSSSLPDGYEAAVAANQGINAMTETLSGWNARMEGWQNHLTSLSANDSWLGALLGLTATLLACWLMPQAMSKPWATRSNGV